MKASKRKRLEANGWSVGSVSELLGLTDEDALFVELKVALSMALRDQREKRNMTQTQIAALISSSQSRVAKMEGGDPSVTLDLIVKALLALGTTRRQLAKIIGT